MFPTYIFLIGKLDFFQKASRLNNEVLKMSKSVRSLHDLNTLFSKTRISCKISPQKKTFSGPFSNLVAVAPVKAFNFQLLR